MFNNNSNPYPPSYPANAGSGGAGGGILFTILALGAAVFVTPEAADWLYSLLQNYLLHSYGTETGGLFLFLGSKCTKVQNQQ